MDVKVAPGHAERISDMNHCGGWPSRQIALKVVYPSHHNANAIEAHLGVISFIQYPGRSKTMGSISAFSGPPDLEEKYGQGLLGIDSDADSEYTLTLVHLDRRCGMLIRP